jgi:chemotaxis protein CheC
MGILECEMQNAYHFEQGENVAKILIVDDSATSRSIAERLIGGTHEATQAASGREALDLLSKGRFDLVILDLLMPEMGGFEVLGELAARGSRVPVIVATADIQNATRAHAKALGAASLINKPLTKAALEAAISSILRPSSPAALPPLEPLVRKAFEGLMRSAIEKAAGVLNTMLSSPIALSTPDIEMISAEGLSARFALMGRARLAAIEMRCAGGFEASIELIFASEDASRLADCVTGACEDGMIGQDSLRAGALCEIGNIVINAVLGTISNSLDVELSFSVPSYIEGDGPDLVGEISLVRHGIILLVRTVFEVRHLSISGDIALFLSLDSFESLTAKLRELAGNGP